MTKVFKAIKWFFSTYRHALILLIFLPLYGVYFVSSNFIDPVWTVHCPLDDKIPFVPWFIIFYFVWYVYITLPLVWLSLSSRNDLLRMAMFLFIGMWICNITFFIVPTQIEFRAEAERQIADQHGFIPFLCKFIYGADKPRNVFPSLHCFESVAIHVTMCHSRTAGPYRKWLHPLSLALCVMICLSTVFVRQHSVIDSITGVLLAVPVACIVYIPKWKFLAPERETLPERERKPKKKTA